MIHNEKSIKLVNDLTLLSIAIALTVAPPVSGDNK